MHKWGRADAVWGRLSRHPNPHRMVAVAGCARPSAALHATSAVTRRGWRHGAWCCLDVACSAQLSSLVRGYTPRDPTCTALYGLVAEQRATFASVAYEEGGAPAFVNDAFERFLRCGVLAYGFARCRLATRVRSRSAWASAP
jgi:hypothetical protein